MDSVSETASAKPKVEIGVVLTGPWERPRVEAAAAASERMRARLADLLPGFDWRCDAVERHEAAPEGPVEPVLLLDEAERERDRRGWDFVFVLTESDLVSYTRRSAVAAPSRALSAAVVSTGRLTDRDDAAEALERRLFALLMHLFGRLNGLEAGERGGFMHGFGAVRQLDSMDGFADAELAELRESLEAVADLRVEEQEGRRSLPAFYLRSLWENRRALPGAIMRMRPWSFPLRLSRLTTAAGSALAVLMMTAESWEVAANLPGPTIPLLSLATLAATSIYLLRAQRLLARPGDAALREQRAVSDVSTVLAVAIGMAVTWLAILVTAWLAGLLLFGDPLLAKWVREDALRTLPVRAQMSGFTAALSLVIGALGASFEPQGYFRHVTHIDDEI